MDNYMRSSIYTIVLADDDPDDQQVFQQAVHTVAPNVLMTSIFSGAELIDYLDEHIPDILFIDLNMPYKNGIECLREIRENGRYRKLPIVVYSTSGIEHTINISYGFGANLYFQKTSSLEELKTAIRLILEMPWQDPQSVTFQHFTDNKFKPFIIENN
jgi:CheY-like chemotaxis protein